MKWEKRKLLECTDYITDGDHQPAPKSEQGIHFIKIKDIVNNQISFDANLYVPREYYMNLPEDHKPQKGDILYTVVGSFGIPSYVKTDETFCFERNIALLHPLSTIDARFLYYCLSNPLFYKKVEGLANGSAQKLIPLNKLKNLEIDVPEIDVQHYIADILSAYDDLIENNQKQIKLLEEAAQRLYKEWFVDLRFPGHENTEIVDGVPKGWIKGRADEFYEITIGKTPSRAEKECFTSEKTGVTWVSISDMGHQGVFTLDTKEDLTEEAIKRYNVKIVPRNTILLSFKLTVGRVAITVHETCTNEAIAHFRVMNEWEREYAYLYLKNFQYKELGNTSSISNAVNSKIVKAMPFIMPNEMVVRRFSEQAKKIFDLILNQQQMMSRLREARDKLLPKLMSGEMKV